MIIVDEDPNSGERSPLKSPTTQKQPAVGSPPPPPPYAPAAAHHHSYHSGTPGAPLNIPPPVTVLVLQREAPLKRFLKAFGVALIILFLWSLFIDSLDMALNGPRRGGPFGADKPETPHGMEWLVHNWYKGAAPTSAPCSCSESSAPATGIVRALPIEYPPTARPQIELALPTLSTPCLIVTPTPVPQES